MSAMDKLHQNSKYYFVQRIVAPIKEYCAPNAIDISEAEANQRDLSTFAFQICIEACMPMRG